MCKWVRVRPERSPRKNVRISFATGRVSDCTVNSSSESHKIPRWMFEPLLALASDYRTNKDSSTSQTGYEVGVGFATGGSANPSLPEK